MLIAIHNANVGFEEELTELLKSNSHTVTLCDSEEFIRILEKTYSTCRNPLNDADVYNCFIMNTVDHSTVDEALNITLAKYEGLIKTPRIILLTGLLSWAGRRYHVPIGGSISEFTSRVPASKEASVYKLENKFHSCATISGMDMCLIGSGLLYGGPGYDLKNLLTSVWSAEKTDEIVVFSLSGGKNYVPMIHYIDLVRIVAHIADVEALPAFFVPAVDFSSLSLEDVVSNLAVATKRKLRISTKAEAVEEMLESTEDGRAMCSPRRWNLDMRFSDSQRLNIDLKHPSGMSVGCGELWREYLSNCSTQPCTILVCGPPASLKTTLAKRLAERLKITYLDPITCMKYIISSVEAAAEEELMENEKNHQQLSAGDMSTTLDLSTIEDPMLALKIELRRILTVLIQGDKKKSKADDPPIDLTAVEWTDSLAAGIPADLKRRCAKWMIAEDTTCARNGYVLDMWESTVKEFPHIFEVTSTKPDPNNVNSKELMRLHSMDEESVVSGVSQTKSTSPPTTESMEKLPRLIVELQSSNESIVDRMTTSFTGASSGGKLSKDQQAVLKELESKLSEYASHMVDIPDKASQTQEGCITKTHSLVNELEKSGYVIQRIDVSHIHSKPAEPEEVATAESALLEVCSQVHKYYADTHGELTWLVDSTQSSNEIASEKQEQAETENLDVPETSNGGQSNNEVDAVPSSEQTVVDDLRPFNAIDNINAGIAALSESVRGKIVENCSELDQYLVDNVLPHIAEALVKINREHVEDPVYYMAEFLKQRGAEVQEAETTAAYEKFLYAVHQAEAMEQEAAAELLAMSSSSNS